MPSLTRTRDAKISVTALAPWIAKFADKYGANPQLIAAVVAQESSFINHGVHRDGTGHGLIGLDDKGLLPDFEKWSGLKVGRGRRANTIPPEKQIEFLAMKLASFTDRFGGDEWEAVRAWHGGVGGRDRSYAKEYEQIIRRRISEIAHAVPRVTAGAAPPDEYQPRPAQPVRLVADAGTPVRGNLDYP